MSSTTQPNASQPVLACVDGSGYTDSVCAHAAWASQNLAAPVELLHILPPPSEHPIPSDFTGAIGLGEKSALLKKLTELDEERSKLDLQKGKLLLAHAEEQLRAAGIEAVTTHHQRGSLVETISELEAATQLIVLGKRGEHANFTTLHLGSNLERVVRAVHKPILVASRAFKPINSFVIAYDGGASANKALEYIASQPLLRGLSCHLLKIGSENAENRSKLADAVAILAQAGFQPRAQLLPGQPDEVIASYVQENNIDLLVMGAYGHSRLRLLFIGSTTSSMLRSCPIPVLLFR